MKVTSVRVTPRGYSNFSLAVTKGGPGDRVSVTMLIATAKELDIITLDAPVSMMVFFGTYPSTSRMPVAMSSRAGV